ncbi:Gut esterase 1 [Seminavis robusta]|uniref:Gut esterase 1 n=1 Tax=Seminavis robusta TaxID=568900 RepID=A0A9N8D4C2_9STRA|nr:Gut esterase 1 [Seminavis robusta]|eukprot:Sro1_g000940.1 Gut esterase 1 (1247) ;mRNA; f:284041-287883
MASTSPPPPRPKSSGHFIGAQNTSCTRQASSGGKRHPLCLRLLLLFAFTSLIQSQSSDPRFPPPSSSSSASSSSASSSSSSGTESQQQQQYGPQQQQQQQSTSSSSSSSSQAQQDTTTEQAYSYGLAETVTGDYSLMDHSTHSGENNPNTKSLIINIPSLGKLQGKRDAGIDFYGGIPYAAPAVGQLRFAPPEPPPPWAPVVLDGTHYGPDCWQLEDSVMNPGAKKEFMSEDCLSLNIFTPAGHARRVGSGGGGLFGGSGPSTSNAKLQEKLLPVLVWLHGGAFQQGGARRPEYNGHRLAERDVIVVTINYRLGALGFLVSSTDGITGNFGLMDQRAALHFVHDNIIHFGGDPSRVTLFGESAGAAMTGQHLMMEGAGTLFQAAIMQSNPLGYHFRSVVIADFIGEALKRSVDCRDLECLRAERVEEIMLAQKSLMGVPRSVSDVFTWGPTLTQERNLNVGGAGASSSSSSGAASSGGRLNMFQDGLLVDYEDIQHQRRRRNKGKRARDAYSVNVTQPLKGLHLIPDHIPIIIGSNQHEGEMFVHSAFPITMSKPVYWMFVGALFRDSASRVLKHYRGYVDQIEAEANELARKQVDEEENKLYYLEHQKQLEEEYEMLLAMNASRRVVQERDAGFQALMNSWSTGGAQDDPPGNSEDSMNGTSTKGWYSNIFQAWMGQSQPTSPKDGSKEDSLVATDRKVTTGRSNWPNLGRFRPRRIPSMRRIRNIMSMAKKRVPFLQEKDPRIEAEKAAERELRRKARAKQKVLKEAAKVVVDYRPVMSRIITDYLFRCPSWHYAHVLSRNRVQNSDNAFNQQQGGGDTMDDSRSRAGKRDAKHKYKRSRNNNNVYVYRFSQPTHIPGYKECWGKSCHTAELPYVFEAMSIIRSHYSTLGPFAQAEAPVAPEYPFTDILTAYQGALEEMEEDEDLFDMPDEYDDDDDDDEVEDLMWKGSSAWKANEFGRGGDQSSDSSSTSPAGLSSLLTNYSSSTRAQRNNNMPESKAFQRVLKNMFGDYFVEDADEEIAADMAERWVAFAKFGEPNYDGSKANWLPWRYLPTQTTDDAENSEIPWQPQDFEYMDDELEEDEEDEDSSTSGFQWSKDRAERIYRKRALKALGMEVIEEDWYRTELRRMTTASELNEMDAVFTFLFGNAESNNRRRRQQKDGSTTKMSKRAIRQVQEIAQAMGVVGTGLQGEPARSSSSSSSSSNASWDDDFFPEMLDLKWPPEGRLVERDCTCDMWERIRYRY